MNPISDSFSSKNREARFIMKRGFKKALFLLVAFAICLCEGVDAYSANSDGPSQAFAKLHSPILNYLVGLKPVYGPTTIADADGKPLLITLPYIQSARLGNMIDKVLKSGNPQSVFHNNFLIKALTFGDKASLGHLNSAYFLGENYVQYFLFASNGAESFYIDKAFDAPSVLLYGYSWLINLPAKYLDILDGMIEYASQMEKIFGFSFGQKVLATVDWLISIVVSIFVEIPIAFFNTIIGFFIGLIYHPFDSLCSIPGMFYFGILSTFNAIWGIIVNIIMIPVHIIF